MNHREQDITLNTLAEALTALRLGRPVIVVDDENRENEGDLIIPAAHVTAEWINFMASHARGLVCVAMTGETLDRLGIPMMVPGGQNGSKYASPFTVSVEAATGVTTGISAFDRAETIKNLIDPASTRKAIRTPGHVFPLRAHPNGLWSRRGHTEAAVTLCNMIGVFPAGVICEIMNPDGSMARLPQLSEYAKRHDFKLISIDQIVDGLEMGDGAVQNVVPIETPSGMPVVSKEAEASLPTHFGSFNVAAYRDGEGLEHLVLYHGTLEKGAPLVRVHSECLTGDMLGSVRCDCGEQLSTALAQISEAEAGALVYLRQEGRGIGLVNKIRAYALQDEGLDTVDANVCLGFRPDERSYSVAAAILKDLGVGQVRILTNNPAKISGLRDLGISVMERISIEMKVRPENARYLDTKRSRLEHLLNMTKI